MKTFDEAILIVSSPLDAADSEKTRATLAMMEESHKRHESLFKEISQHPRFSAMLREIALMVVATDDVSVGLANGLATCFMNGVVVGMEMEKQECSELS